MNPTDKIGINGGLTVCPWRDAAISVNDTTSSLGYKNVWRGSIGAEYDVDSLHPVRIGYSRQTWYYDAAAAAIYQVEVKAPINENGIHLGTSVPIPKFGALDVSGEVLLRHSPVLDEVAGRLMLTLSYSEAWLKRTRRWGY